MHTRSFATLTQARSSRIADNLKISDPTHSSRCTVCHAPFQSLATDAALTKTLDPASGVSCENCHGAADKWLLSHTRSDYTHNDRVHAGMRNTQNLYVRANTCVACHQNVDADILQAGHPELIFELDGQSVSEPKHWKEKADWSGPQTWLVGQLVALREMSWRLAKGGDHPQNEIERQAALRWLANASVSAAGISSIEGESSATQSWSDSAAQKLSDSSWPTDATRKCLDKLAATSSDFRKTDVPRSIQARRAERLVIGLDRLVIGLNNEAAAKTLDAPLNQLFKDAQSLPDFDPSRFADHLDAFQKALATVP